MKTVTSNPNTQGPGVDRADPTPKPRKTRLIGIDAARGLALVGLMAIHLFPSANEDTGEPTLAWVLFSGDSAALFALLAGVGLALSSGGRTPHRGRRMAGDRIGLVVRAVLIGIIGLVVSALMPEDPPVYGILLYYAAFFLLAIPFLHLRTRALFLSAAVFALISPLILQYLGPLLPASSAYNHTIVHLVTEPAGVASELLVTGAYPALSFMPFILVGLGIGRLDLRSTRVQATIAGAGAALAVLANLVSAVLLHGLGGYRALLATPGMTQEGLDEAIEFGPDTLPDTSAWWLAIATPHTGTQLAIAASLGMALLVLGLFLLVPAKAGPLLRPLSSMGSMTLTLYSVHLLALAPEVHYDEPALWYILHLTVAVAFAMLWSRWMGQGPLERMVAAAAGNARQIMDDGDSVGTSGGSTRQVSR